MHLTTAGEAALADATAVLVAIGEDPGLSVGALERYARLVDELASMREHFDAQRRPGHVLGGATGRSKVSPPLLGDIREHEKLVERAARELGLTPAARAAMRRGVGRPPGASQSTDRRPGLRSVP